MRLPKWHNKIEIPKHEHIVRISHNTITVILPLKQCPDDSLTATYMYVAGWNDAMKKASSLVAELRLGVYEFVDKDSIMDSRLDV